MCSALLTLLHVPQFGSLFHSLSPSLSPLCLFCLLFVLFVSLCCFGNYFWCEICFGAALSWLFYLGEGLRLFTWCTNYTEATLGCLFGLWCLVWLWTYGNCKEASSRGCTYLEWSREIMSYEYGIYNYDRHWQKLCPKKQCEIIANEQQQQLS